MGEKMTTFDDLIARSKEHSDREAGLPGRPDPVARWSITWRGACGVPVVRYGCTGDPDACPYKAGEQGGEKA